VNLVRASLQKNHSPKIAAQLLANVAYDAGSMDNISVLIVKLN
jgi:serine/threonine protein phosphatase PrpC